MKVVKVTHGWVTQTYDTETGKCVEQKFHAGDIVTFETEEGMPLTHGEQTDCLPYHEFDMAQPVAPNRTITQLVDQEDVCNRHRDEVLVFLPKDQVEPFIQSTYEFWLAGDFSISFKEFLLTEHKDKVQEVADEDFIEILL